MRSSSGGEPQGMRVLLASPEVDPYAKTGGLADVLRALPKALSFLGVDVRVIMPLYKQVVDGGVRPRPIVEELNVSVGSKLHYCGLYEHVSDDGIVVYFIANDQYFFREGLYGTPQGDYPDNAARFVFFSRGVAEALPQQGWVPDLIHCHDWQTGMIPVYLRTLYRSHPSYANCSSLFTVHNMAYQGKFPREDFALTGLGWEEYTPAKLEFWGDWGMLKGGLVYADLLSTVSERYSQEIQTLEYGCGLDGVLRARSADLYGVLNGLDHQVWNPSTDAHIRFSYGPNNLSLKRRNKEALYRTLGLELNRLSSPLMAMVARLSAQKGVDLLLSSLEGLMEMGVMLVVLGVGDEGYQRALVHSATRHPGRVAAVIRFDPVLARRIYAGADFFLMPSRYEPCGLTQMIALSYGTIPVVYATGGLVDTVGDYREGEVVGNGFVFDQYSPSSFLGAVTRALRVYRKKGDWLKLRRAAMACRFTWEEAARKYIGIYQKTLEGQCGR